MANSLQDFLADATPHAAKNLEEALFRLPEDKRNWSAGGDARTAMDMVAECAILSDMSAIVMSRSFPKEFDLNDFVSRKTALAQDWDAAKAMLSANVEKAVALIKSVPEEDLGIEIEMPWGTFTIAHILSYPYWNMSYHEGQINFIASMLGCLD